MHGGFSQFSVVKAKYCYVLQRDISPTEAVLLEPMGRHEEFIMKIFS